MTEEAKDKRVQHYMVLATAWIGTKMEHDKTIITLSAGAIGLLITVLTTKGIVAAWHIWLFIISFGAFISAIISCLVIFQQNSKIIELELNEAKVPQAQKTKQDHHLKRLDKVSLSSFIIGTVAFMLIGIFSAVNKPKESDKTPPTQKGSATQQQCSSAKKLVPNRTQTKKKQASKPCQNFVINCVQQQLYSSCKR